MTTPVEYTDYLFSAPNLNDIAAALVALRDAGLVGAGDVPDNMLGDPVTIQVPGQPDPMTIPVPGQPDPATQLATATTITIRARQGRAASSYVDPGTGLTVQVPGDGDPALWYVAVRTTVPPSAVPFDPTTLGLTPVDPATSAAVLGTWF